jgi:hypothetical protein
MVHGASVRTWPPERHGVGLHARIHACRLASYQQAWDPNATSRQTLYFKTNTEQLVGKTPGRQVCGVDCFEASHSSGLPPTTSSAVGARAHHLVPTTVFSLQRSGLIPTSRGTSRVGCHCSPSVHPIVRDHVPCEVVDIRENTYPVWRWDNGACSQVECGRV